MLNLELENKEEYGLVHDIAVRAVKGNPSFNLMDLEMDIIAVHVNDCKLKLQELLEADTFNFFHDINGISQHINRKNGKLQNCFLPRYSV